MKYQTKILIYILFAVIFFIISCKDQHTEELLNIADTHIEEHPDSALQILNQIDSNDISDNGQLAYYYLLRSQALYKTNQKQTAKDLDFSINYYGDNGNYPLLQRALFYRAEINYERDPTDLDSIVSDYLDAEQLITNKSDSLLVFRIYNSLRVIYMEHSDLDKDLEYSKKEVDYTERHHNMQDRLLAYLDYTNALRTNDDTLKADSYIDKIRHLVQYKTPDLDNNLYCTFGYYHAQHKNYKEAIAYYKKALAKNEDYSTITDLTEALLATENVDEARLWINRLMQSGNKESYYAAHQFLSQINESIGNYQQAYLHLKTADSIDILRKYFVDCLDIEGSTIKYDLAAKEWEKEENIWKAIIICALIVIMILTLWIFTSIKLYKKKQKIQTLEISLANNKQIFEQLLDNRSQSFHEKTLQMERAIQNEKEKVDELRNLLKSKDLKLDRNLQVYTQQLKQKQKLVERTIKLYKDKELELTNKNKRLAQEQAETKASYERCLECVFRVMQNERNILYSKDKQIDFLTGYELVRPDYIELLNQPDYKFTPLNKTICLLYSMGKTSLEITKLLGCTIEALKQNRFRLMHRIEDISSLNIFYEHLFSENKGNEML